MYGVEKIAHTHYCTHVHDETPGVLERNIECAVQSIAEPCGLHAEDLPTSNKEKL